MRLIDCIRPALRSGAAASLASTAALALFGHRETGSPWRPLNAISHWVWGDRVLHLPDASLRHTALGYAIHHTMATGWAVGFERLWRGRLTPPQAATVVGAAAGVAAVSCLVDFRCTPHRFTPGFQHHLSRPAIGWTYAAFGAGLLLAAWCEARHGVASTRRRGHG